VAVLAVVGVLQGIATIGLAVALTALVVAVVEGMPLRAPALWLAGLFVVRAGLSWVSEKVAAWAGVGVTAQLREALLARWLASPAERRPDPDRAVTLAAQGAASVEPYAARFLPALVAGAVVPALALATLVWVDWISALIVVLTLPLLPFFAALIGKTTRPTPRSAGRPCRRCPGTSSTSCAACRPWSPTAGRSARSRSSARSASSTGAPRWPP